VTDLAEVTDERRMVSTSSGMISPSSKDDATLRPAAWPRTKEVPSGPNGTTSPPSNFGQLFTASTVSLSMGSPSKETDGRPNGGDSPSKAKKDRKEKEVLKWPEHCAYASRRVFHSAHNASLRRFPFARVVHLSISVCSNPVTAAKPSHPVAGCLLRSLRSACRHFTNASGAGADRSAWSGCEGVVLGLVPVCRRERIDK
jgi:hypothetical protein